MKSFDSETNNNARATHTHFFTSSSSYPLVHLIKNYYSRYKLKKKKNTVSCNYSQQLIYAHTQYNSAAVSPFTFRFVSLTG